MDPNKLIAVPGVDADSVGATVFRTLSGDVGEADLRAEWRAAGLDEDLLPPTPSPEVVLARAAAELRSKHRLVRQHPAGGWAVVRERTDAGLDYAVELRVTLDRWLSFEPADHPDREVVEQAFRRSLGRYTHGDVSSWLCRLTRQVSAVPLRRSGGFYFVPRHHVPAWSAMVGALRRASSHAVYSMPTMRADEAVEAVSDAVAREVEEEAACIEAEVGRGKLGLRALESRKGLTASLVTKAREYEALLGKKLEAVRDRLDQLDNDLVAAILLKQAAESEEAA